MSNETHVLVTGANSGLGLEAARQLAARPKGRVWISARSQAKAEAARDTLVAATGASADRIGFFIFDLLDPSSIRSAIDTYAAGGVKLDGVVLNAGGMVAPEAGALTLAPDGTTALFAMNVGGHAHLVQGLLDRDLLADGATVVFAGSEASRGIPMMKAEAPALPAGDLDEVLPKVIRGQHLAGKVDPMNEYGIVKLIGTAWMEDLARRHGGRLRALTVSPGMTAGTAGADDMPVGMKVFFKYFMMPLMKLIGKAHGVEAGAARYIRGIEDKSLKSGGFYASAYPTVTGALALQSPEQQPLLENEGFARAAGRLLDGLTGTEKPAVRAVS
ncbi:MAG: SDR family NAD(P)-dependent oxidoreductase [Deltaproteobacteria bacterium]|nr:SDR family NAD(P)-dependent oxidoreductase [Deltaproteobacteria bacterium]